MKIVYGSSRPINFFNINFFSQMSQKWNEVLSTKLSLRNFEKIKTTSEVTSKNFSTAKI